MATETLRTPAISQNRRAKIVCTLGPASNSEATIRELIQRGMDVARLNFSHGTHEDHARVIQRVRRAAEKENRTICILQDLQGPKIRTGHLKHRTPVVLGKGCQVTITPRDIPGTASLISTTFQELAKEVEPGGRILLSDGLIELQVKSICGEDVICEVINGGVLGEHKGINLPGAAVGVPSMTAKDRKDLKFGIEHGVDVVALSFVRSANDVREIKNLIQTYGSDLPVVAKLEKPQAIEHLDEILEVANAVMVARGDLGVEMPPEKVPVIQKEIIARAAEYRKPVITATQMLESMIENPRPTRAEASDVANAIFDGSDAVMLSGETAVGKYPQETVSMMGRIIVEAEAHMKRGAHPRNVHGLSVAETICESVAHAAEEMNMRVIAVFTESGTTARLISKYRPKVPIYAFTDTIEVCRRMNLYWGVHPVLIKDHPQPKEMLKFCEAELIPHGAVQRGDVLGVVTGTRMASGFTNVMFLHVVEGNLERSPQVSARSRSAKGK